MRILAAVNEKDHARLVVEFLTQQQWEKGTEFLVMTVVEPLKVGNCMAVLPGPILDDIFEQHMDLAREVVDETRKALQDKVPDATINYLVVEGNPREEIVKKSNEWPADMIVVSSHNRHGLDRWVTGSVSHGIAETSPCSVVVLRPTEKELALSAQ